MEKRMKLERLQRDSSVRLEMQNRESLGSQSMWRKLGKVRSPERSREVGMERRGV